jgi:hypothetical protein
MTATLAAFIGSNASLIQIAVVSMIAGGVYLLACLACGVWPRADLARLHNAVLTSRGRIVASDITSSVGAEVAEVATP